MAKDRDDTEESPASAGPTESMNRTSPAQTRDPLVGTKVGRYTIRRVIAAGGMGVVYEALQEEPRRTVAVKVMKRGIASRQALRRFAYEAQTLARLRHPGIAQVYEASTHGDDAESVPFFVMEYVPNARPITAYVREKGLGTRQRLELFAQVCDALHHGHQKGVIHRDLKPSNILVDSGGQPKIIDFGVARATDSDLALTTLQTDVGQLIGTLQYMSPEQCDADPHDIDIRSDVYGLGIVLYELLTDRLPYDVRGTSFYAAPRIIREQAPTRPSAQDRAVRGDLETLVLKALEKDRERRYQSALDFAQDIRRYLAGEAILARPPSLPYQLKIFARKHRMLFAATAVVFLVLLGGIVVSTSLYVRSQRAERVSRTEAQKAEAVSAFLRKMLASADPTTARGRELTVREVLDEASRTVETDLAGQPEVQDAVRMTMAETYELLGLGEAGIPHWTWVHDHRRRTLGEGDERTLAALSNLGVLNLVAGRHDETVRIYREALEISRRSLGEEHPRTIDAMSMYGNSLKNQGALTEAEPFLVRCRDIADRVFKPGDESYIWLEPHLSLGHLYGMQGRFREGREEFARAIEMAPKIKTKMWGENGMWTLRVRNEAATLHLQAGWLLDAEEMIDETIVRARRGLGERHPVTAWAVANQGGLFQARGDPAGAEARFRAALAILDQADPDHTMRDDFLSRLTSGLIEQGKIQEARAVTLDRLSRHRKKAGHPDAGEGALNELARLLLTCQPPDLRDPPAALPLAERAVTASGRKNPLFLDTLAQAHDMNGHPDKAIEVLREAVALLPVRWTVQGQEIEERLVRCLEKKGETEASELALRQTLNRRRESLPAGHPDIALALIHLGQGLARHGKRPEAIPLFREALEIRRAAFPAGDWEIAHAAVLLGGLLVDERSFAEAEPLLVDAHAALADERAIPIAPRREARKSLVALYEAWGKPGEAARFREARVAAGRRPER